MYRQSPIFFIISLESFKSETTFMETFVTILVTDLINPDNLILFSNLFFDHIHASLLDILKDNFR